MRVRPMALLVLLVGVLAGCANGLSREERAALGPIEVLILTVQRDFPDVSYPAAPAPITYPRPSGESPWMTSILANAPSAHRANVTWTEQRLELARAARNDFQLEKRAAEAIKAQLQRLNRPTIQGQPIEGSSGTLVRERYAETTASALLVLTLWYRVELHRGIVFGADAELLPKSEALKKFRPKPDESDPSAAGNLIYKEKFAVSVPTGATLDETRGRFVQALNALAREIAAGLKSDL